jgi:hypothetical protein
MICLALVCFFDTFSAAPLFDDDDAEEMYRIASENKNMMCIIIEICGAVVAFAYLLSRGCYY